MRRAARASSSSSFRRRPRSIARPDTPPHLRFVSRVPSTLPHASSSRLERSLRPSTPGEARARGRRGVARARDLRRRDAPRDDVAVARHPADVGVRHELVRRQRLQRSRPDEGVLHQGVDEAREL